MAHSLKLLLRRLGKRGFCRTLVLMCRQFRLYRVDSLNQQLYLA